MKIIKEEKYGNIVISLIEDFPGQYTFKQEGGGSVIEKQFDKFIEADSYYDGWKESMDYWIDYVAGYYLSN